MQRNSRRRFLKTTVAAGVGFWVGTSRGATESRSPNERLNIGVIGAGGKGGGDTQGVSSENIVALCDVDLKRARKTFEAFPHAKVYRDYREMLDKEKLDAVVVSTPDHSHAPASLRAMRRGLHVYCQKPMAHTIQEARWMRVAARKYKVVTQMGNQGTAAENMRRVVEWVQAGAFGQIREAHVWTNRPIWPQGKLRPKQSMPVPEHLRWDLWLGVAPERPYHEVYLPGKWRGWWDFGQGALGDMGCHNLNLPFWSLQLTYPTLVEATSRGMTEEMAPLASRIRYKFPARGNLPPVTLYWYDGDNRPPRELLDGLPPEKRVADITNGVLLVGSEGKVYAPSSHCRLYEFWPRKKYADFKGPEPTIPRIETGKEAHNFWANHYREWIRACKGGPATMSNFDYASRLTEVVLLGNVAIRCGQTVESDPVQLRVKNHPEANRFLRKEYRNGWLES